MLVKSAHSKTEMIRPIKIITPPIVGVPIFLIIWSLGPSSLIGLKIFLSENNLINGPPIKRAISNEVKKANPVLKVMYLKTFKKVKISTYLIKGPPIIKTIANDVNRDNPVLKVMYLKTFKKPIVSTKFSKNW